MNMAGESVWDYPRPPRLERTVRRIRMVHGGVVLAETTEALRVLETSHPPVYYIPSGQFAAGVLERSRRRQSFCEFKGLATYWNVRVAGVPVVEDAGWSYEVPTPGFKRLAGHVAVYASRVDECWVDGERVVAQPGDFYGGWITSDLRGPFKGSPGTMGW